MPKIPAAVRKTLKAAVTAYRGDDLYRARVAFKNADLDKELGNSGRTRRDVLSEYEQHDAACDAAIAFLEEHQRRAWRAVPPLGTADDGDPDGEAKTKKGRMAR